MRNFTLITSLFLIIACNGTKETTGMEKTENSTQNKEMLAAGFTKGTIVHSDKEGDCEYTIKLEDGRYFESTDLTQEFMKDGMTVWFTFNPLRRMSKCNKANPVTLTEIKKG